MKTHFEPEWQEWIKTNLNTGQDPDGIFKILLDEGYAYAAIVKQMNYQPSKPSWELVNPFNAKSFKQQQGQQLGNNQHSQQNAALKDNNGQAIKASEIFIPNSRTYHEDKLDLRTVDNFLNADECKKIVELIKTKLRPSEISNFEVNKKFRTSRTCDLGEFENDFIDEIDERICKLVGIDPAYSEVTQGQYYEVGQEFKAHTDFFEKSEFDLHCSEFGQRTYTVMIYLNDVKNGGETCFVKIDEAFQPKTGTAVIWNSLNPDGTPNQNTMHHAKPVLKGNKAVITKWFRTKPRGKSKVKMLNKEINEFVPNFTREGVFKSQLPPELFQSIKTFYKECKNSRVDEHVQGGFIYSDNKATASPVSSSLIDLSSELRQEVHDTMKPLMEKWCEKSLEPTFVYGIREYHNGAILKPHRDRISTHIISAILNVDQDVNEDWPLVIEDNYYRQHHVMLKPGEMVFYEGARLTHGRPIAFNGKVFANIFCHFKPVDYVPPVEH